MQHSQFIALGILFVFIGMLIIIFSSILLAAKDSSRSKAKFSFVGLIGPIPFGISNDKRLFLISLIIAIVLFILSIFWFTRYFRGA